MKRYLLFTYDIYYPRGGMYDFKISFDSIHECIEFFKKTDDNKCQIFDNKDNVIVYTTDLLCKIEVYQDTECAHIRRNKHLKDIFPQSLWQ